MNIFINMDGHDNWQLTITHLVKLFFDEAEITFQNSGTGINEHGQAANLHIDILFAESVVRLQTADEPKIIRTRTVSTHKNTSATDDPHQTLKRAVLRTLLTLLEEHTGLSQPWGILTGVRPTKLMHKWLREMSETDALRTMTDTYLLDFDKARLLAEIVRVQQQAIPDLYELQNEVSLYIGIPFCPTKCAYCTFPAYDIEQYRMAVTPFLEGLIGEMRAVGDWLRTRDLKVTTIYWGGGTPTSISVGELDHLLKELALAIPFYQDVRETTVEAGRPDTISADKIKVLRRHQIDRMSINPQSFTQATLDTIGRHHTVSETIAKFHLCREYGVDNINMDLIVGLPDEGLAHIRHSLEELDRLLPESLTVHTLSFKRASRMTQDRGAYEVAGRDEIETMMALTEHWTTAHGYRPYYLYRQKNILGNLENVGYAMPGRESLYNIVMMEELQTIIGIGCGAVSKILFQGEQGAERIERFANPKEPAQYNAAWESSLTRKLQLLNEAYPLQRAVSSV